MNDLSRPHLFGLLAGLFLATGLICASFVVTSAWLKIAESQTVQVTGSARKGVRADLALWRGSFAVEAATLLDAQRKLRSDGEQVERMLKANGAANYQVSPITIQEVRASERNANEAAPRRIVGYHLVRSVEVQASDMDLVTRLDQTSTALIEQGVVFTTSAPQYIYTKAGEAKVEMLAEATKDARARADQIASQGGRRIAQLRSARMGVFQITPLHSVQTSWDGINDTTSLDKTVTAVVTASFSLH